MEFFSRQNDQDVIRAVVFKFALGDRVCGIDGAGSFVVTGCYVGEESDTPGHAHQFYALLDWDGQIRHVRAVHLVAEGLTDD